jgi:ribosomal protein S17
MRWMVTRALGRRMRRVRGTKVDTEPLRGGEGDRVSISEGRDVNTAMADVPMVCD